MGEFRLAALMALAAGSILGLSNANARSAATGPARCFYNRDWSGWTVSPDAKSMYIGTRGRDIYRLDFAGGCRAAQGVGVHLISRIRGGSYVCSPLDLDLKVSDGRGFAISCIVSKITPLSTDEAAALPKGLRP